ncbi:EAL domain-containing protein [Effusibacillus dendaii]|uniref:GGDEF domain-containing protein n=1 Tax=Effusibacillus dendaii TaxID=2743772 RepID=A0A7I8DBU3_9BACL|nr:EAL domain-containing protein [Effusibacillus dendaii]BCJ87628.1 GGDEF domain-containing protein [Effusibacillus dendaii]
MNPFRIMLLYILASIGWFVISDRILNFFVENLEKVLFLQIFNGLFFVLVTSWMLHLLISRNMAQLQESEEKYQAVLDNIRDGYYEVDLAGKFTELNQSLCEIFGYSREDLLNMNNRDYTDEKTSAEIYETFNRVFRTGEPVTSYEFKMNSKEGKERFIDISISLICNAKGEPTGFRGICRDITERKEAERRLEESEQRYRSIVEYNTDMIFSVSIDGKVLTMSPAVEKFLGYQMEELIGQDVISYVCPEEWPSLRVRMDNVRKGQPQEYEVTVLHKNGKRLIAQITSFPITADNKVTGIYGIAKDVTERNRAIELINHMAYHDALTDLPNRRYFQERLLTALHDAKIRQHKVGLIFLDLDHFKNINDMLGHAVGDLLLQTVADRLRQCIQNDEVVGRMGGDEFTVLMPSISDSEELVAMVDRIFDAFRYPINMEGSEFLITTSIGAAIYPDDGEDMETLMKNADSAMYTAKEQGKSTYQLYMPNTDTGVFQRLTLESELQRALEREEFVVYYQPQIDVSHNSTVGLEALVRWKHPKRGLLTPAEFIPLAEETGMIIQIGEWVLRKVCRQSRIWQDAGLPPLRVAVNISTRQFQQRNFVDLIEQVLQETGLEAKYLELELIENISMKNTGSVTETLKKLKSIGLHISIDDFGTGYSSLSYLKQFPVDSLKIDQSFIREITNDPDDAAIVQAIIALAHNLKLKVIAEGVETVEQLRFLEANQCDVAQGHLLGKPMSASEIQALHRKTVRPSF